YLGMFTGYSKAFAEMCVLVACAGVLGVRVARDGRGLVAFNVAMALALALHRSALGLVPALGLVWALAPATQGGAPWRRAGTYVALAAPLAALAWLGPRIAATVLHTDAVHFTPYEVAHGGGVLAAAFAGTRAFDLLSLVLLLSPLAIALPFVAPLLGMRP